MRPYNRTVLTGGLTHVESQDREHPFDVSLIGLIHRLKRNFVIREIVCA